LHSASTKRTSSDGSWRILDAARGPLAKIFGERLAVLSIRDPDSDRYAGEFRDSFQTAEAGVGDNEVEAAASVS
jgi:hypothetical protein